jgi:hypothetical protein
VSTTISGSVYDDPAFPLDTLVGIDASILTINLSAVFLETYAPWGPLWDSDSTVQGYMDDWVTLDGFVTKTIDTDGTYGIEERLTNLYTAKTVTQANKDKYDAMIPVVQTYAT